MVRACLFRSESRLTRVRPQEADIFSIIESDSSKFE